MDKQDAKFILEKDPALAVNLARLSARHSNDMWKVLMEEGLLGAIRSQTGARRDLMESLVRIPKTEDATTILGNILGDMRQKQREALFCNVRRSSVIFLDWINSSMGYKMEKEEQSIAPDKKLHLMALVKVAQSHGLEINTLFKAVGHRGALYESSVLRESLSNSLYSRDFDWSQKKTIANVDFLFEMGGKLDLATKVAVMGNPSKEGPVAVVRWFEEKGYAQPQEWLEAKGQKNTLPQNFALLQSHFARSAIENMTSAKFQEKKSSP